MEKSKEWNMKKADGKTYGPVATSTVEEWIQQKRIEAGDLIAEVDSDDWQPVENKKQFAPLFKAKGTKVAKRTEDAAAKSSDWKEEDLTLVKKLHTSLDDIKGELANFIVGQEEVIKHLLTAVLSRGHCLMEGVPGLAKTMIVSCLAKVMDLSFHRVQFTPDLMPSDITGTNIIQEDPKTGKKIFQFQPGPIFANIILADEINRTPPKTQAALLQAMQEREITVGKTTYSLDKPFFVLATQNPIEQEGTYPLPEAQQDRFMFHVKVDYPSRKEEKVIVQRTTGTYKWEMRPLITKEEILSFQKLIPKVPAGDHVFEFILNLVRFTRPKTAEAPAYIKKWVEWGAGPRACQYLMLAGKVKALMESRLYVTMKDIEDAALPVLRHRILPSFDAEAEGITSDDIIQKVISEISGKKVREPV